MSTLGCPDWDAPTVVARASAFGYDAIEWRGGPDGTVRTEWPGQRRTALRTAVADAGLASIAITAYPNFISGDRDVRRRSLEEIEAHAELADALGAPWVRIFVGIADDASTPAELRQRAVEGIVAALERTEHLGVGLAIEPHDAHARAADLKPILDAIPDARLGVVWDLGNAWAAGETPDVGFTAYRGRIAWTQVKDGTGAGPGWRLVDVGAGEVPIERALELLAGARGIVPRSSTGAGSRVADPRPVVSLEWERAWHPDLASPDVAFPAALAWLRVAADQVAADQVAANQVAADQAAR